MRVAYVNVSFKVNLLSDSLTVLSVLAQTTDGMTINIAHGMTRWRVEDIIVSNVLVKELVVITVVAVVVRGTVCRAVVSVVVVCGFRNCAGMVVWLSLLLLMLAAATGCHRLVLLPLLLLMLAAAAG